MFLPVMALVVLAAAAPDTAVYPLNEVIVTGARIGESVLRTPSAVSVRHKSDFANVRHLSLADALSGIPGVLSQSRAGAGDARITIRGYGARGSGERSNVGTMRGIRVLTDGIPVTEPDGRTALDLVDLGSADRIEVNRSNASALYGNASGGVVHLRSHMIFDRPWIEFTQQGGSFGYHRERGAAGFVLGRSSGVFSLANTTFDGWRAHSQSWSTQASLRFSAPVDDGTRIGLLADFVSDLHRFPGALTAAQLAADPSQANPTYVNRNDRRRNRQGRIAATLGRTSAAQELSLAMWAEPKVLQRSERGRYREFNRYHVGGSAVWSREFTLPSGAKLRTTVGGDDAFQDGTIQFWELGIHGTKSTIPVANQREGANGGGVFVQQSFAKGAWTASAAARYDNLWYISEDNQDSTLNSTQSFSRVTPKGSVSYQLGHQTLYAALGGGVESPAFNEIDPPPTLPFPTAFNPFLEPSVSTTYELGTRGLVGMRTRYDVALYWIDVKNDIIPFDGGAYFFTAGRTRRRGLEAALDWAPMSALSLGGSASLSHNEYRTYTSDLGTFDGNDVAGLPAAIFAAHARWRWQALTTEVSVNGNDRYFADDRNSIRVPGHGLLNASVSYDRALSRGSFRIFVAGSNLLDKDHIASVFINPAGAPPDEQVFEPGLPRRWNAGLSATWR